ncbi:inositol monophosphatase, partial [Candidatus Sumerlaeota bacterium]|nr:inositol monophosphatase [Candidatus Sumerlaeota bacterium]
MKQPKPFRDRTIEATLREAAELGVGVIRKYHRNLESIEKKGQRDLVTKADREAEAAVLDFLRKRHPGHTFIGEETWKEKSASAPAGFAWVLDPVDGTTNFAHGLDHYGLSLGLLLDGEPVAGIVADPERGHFYHAARGRGAFRNRTRLHVSNKSRLIDSILATGFPYDRGWRIEELMSIFGAFLREVQGMRRFGVSSLDLAFVAAGHFDGYYESPLHIWDIAAGVLLVT